MSDDIDDLQEQFNSIRALFLTAVESRSGIKLDSASVQNLDGLLQGYQSLLRNFVQELRILRFVEQTAINASTDPTPKVSVALEELLELMEPHYGSGEVVLPGETYDGIFDGLCGLRDTAAKAERELEAFAGLESARFGAGVMEEVSTDAAGHLLLDGNVIRPKFGGRS